MVLADLLFGGDLDSPKGRHKLKHRNTPLFYNIGQRILTGQICLTLRYTEWARYLHCSQK